MDASASGSKCYGASNAQLVESLVMRAGATRPCYERELRANPRAAGRVLLAVRIREDGDVQSVDVVEDSTQNSSLVSCLTGIFRGAHFPAPIGGCVVAKVPLSFVPREAPDGGDTRSDAGSDRTTLAR
jgi:hypothetical protein